MVQDLVVATQNKCKRHKNKQREELAVLNAIKNSIGKIIDGISLIFVLVYLKDAIFACMIGKYVIIYNKRLLQSQCIGCYSDKWIVNI